ncbi:MAG: hypothetical protein ACK56F_23520 [bacterium]
MLKSAAEPGEDKNLGGCLQPQGYRKHVITERITIPGLGAAAPAEVGGRPG